MFPAEKKGEWEPLKVRERKITKSYTHNEADEHTNGDISMGEAKGEQTGSQEKTEIVDEEETLYEEDPTTEEGAVWPIENGRVVNWSCFFALLTHVYNTLSPPFHTPILVISQPAWTAHDHEILTQFFFEKFRTPAFCLMDAALAACYAYATATATVVDVGHGKCDVSAVSDFVVYDIGRGAALAGCGGNAMTQRLYDLLNAKGLSKDACEQMKRNPICEILPIGTELPGESERDGQLANPAGVASTSATVSGDIQGGQAGGSVPDIDVGDGDQDRESKVGEDNEGVLDVATIVASGKTSEFLARKEKEKLEKAAAKKAAGELAAANKQARLPNSKRLKATFTYTERKPLEELNSNGKRAANGELHQDGIAKRQRSPEPVSPTLPDGAENSVSARKEERRRNREAATAFVRKEIEVGVERFQAASGGVLDGIADAIHRAILSVPDSQKRPELWDSLIIVGNGSKVKGREILSAPLYQADIYHRIQGRTCRYPQRQIPHLSLKHHNLYLRASLQLQHPCRYRRKHPSTPSSSSAFPPWRRRQPPSPRCNHSFASTAAPRSPGSVTPSATPISAVSQPTTRTSRTA